MAKSDDRDTPELVHLSVYLTPAEREALDWYVLTERRQGNPSDRGTERLCKTAFYEGLRTIVELHRADVYAARFPARKGEVHA